MVIVFTITEINYLVIPFFRFGAALFVFIFMAFSFFAALFAVFSA